jgi:hypothetical protein
MRDSRVTGTVGLLPWRPQHLPSPVCTGRAFDRRLTASEHKTHSTSQPPASGFSPNIRYLGIPSRFVPVIPTCWGYIYPLILSLDGRDELVLAFESSARGYEVRPGSPKRGCEVAPRYVARARVALPLCGVPAFRNEDVPGRCPDHDPDQLGVRHRRRESDAVRNSRSASRGNGRRLILRAEFRLAAA